LAAPENVAAAPTVRAYDEQGSFLGLVEVTADRAIRVQRLFVAGAGTATCSRPLSRRASCG
jgi:hypothetical protein